MRAPRVKTFFPPDANPPYIGILFGGHHENGFNARFQPAIHQSHLQLVFVVGNSSNAAHDCVGVLSSQGVLDQQALKTIDTDGVIPVIDAFEQLRSGFRTALRW